MTVQSIFKACSRHGDTATDAVNEIPRVVLVTWRQTQRLDLTTNEIEKYVEEMSASETPNEDNTAQATS